MTSVNKETYQAVWLLISHGVDDYTCWTDEEDFHEGIVDWHEIPKDVHVSEQEHRKVHFLSLARQTYTDINY